MEATIGDAGRRGRDRFGRLVVEWLVAGTASAGKSHAGFDSPGPIVARAAGDAERGQLYLVFCDGFLRPSLVADGGSSPVAAFQLRPCAGRRLLGSGAAVVGRRGTLVRRRGADAVGRRGATGQSVGAAAPAAATPAALALCLTIPRRNCQATLSVDNGHPFGAFSRLRRPVFRAGRGAYRLDQPHLGGERLRRNRGGRPARAPWKRRAIRLRTIWKALPQHWLEAHGRESLGTKCGQSR